MDKRLELLEKYNFWDGQFPDLGLIRNEYIDKIANAMDNKLIKVLVGQRRSGKSFIMRQLMNHLVTEKEFLLSNSFTSILSLHLLVS